MNNKLNIGLSIVVIILLFVSYFQGKQDNSALQERILKLEQVLDSTLTAEVKSTIENELNPVIQGKIVSEIIRLDTLVYQRINLTNQYFVNIDRFIKRQASQNIWYENTFNAIDSTLFKNMRTKTLKQLNN